jgi:hypothetical protein
MTVKIASTASPTNWMLGDITSYVSGTGALVVNVIYTGGSGTIAAWTLSQSVAATGNATLTSINGGQLAGLRNRIINGDMRVAQRGSVALTIGNDIYGGCDRTFIGAYQFTTATGSINRGGILGSTFSSSGYLQQAQVTTTGSGGVRFGQKIESANCADLNSKTITIQCVLLQDTGAALNANISVYKAGSVDNWSAPTVISSSGNFSVAGDGLTKTKATYTFTLGAADATNGLMIFLGYSGVGAVTAKNFYIGDFQLEIGSVATPFEQRPIGLELALCQRYYEISSAIVNQIAASSQHLANAWFKVTKRVSPTSIVYKSPVGGAAGKGYNYSTSLDIAATTQGTGTDMITVALQTTVSAGNNIAFNYTAEAEL